jgi:hypothetical protein
MLTMAACGGDTGCNTGVSGSCPPDPPTPPTDYVLRVSSASQQLGSVVVSVVGFAGEPTVLTGSQIRVRAVRDGDNWRAIFIGPVAGLDLVRFRAGRQPSVNVLDASGGAAQNYRQVPTSQVQPAFSVETR